MMQADGQTDVAELCGLLQCLGFSVKSLVNKDINASHEGNGTRTVFINCQSSGLQVELQSASLSCSCPTNDQNSGVWQVSGVTGGKQLDKEFGCSLLGSLPKSHRDRLAKELHDIIRCIKESNESETPAEAIDKEVTPNRSASMLELKTPDKLDFKKSNPDTPTRYRSLDTLTGAKKELPLSALGVLQRAYLGSESCVDDGKDKKQMFRRQSTYSLSSTPGSFRRRNKTSSPIQATPNTILESLLEAEREAADLRNKVASIIRDFVDVEKNDSSISSLTLDVSKISVLKGAESSKAQFASSPNLSGIGAVKEDLKGRFQRFESASTSNLAIKSASQDPKISKLRRLSPSFFKMTKASRPVVKAEKVKSLDSKRKLNITPVPKLVTPVRTPRAGMEPSPNLSSSKKKYSHVKSTIPKPSKKE